MLEQVLYELRLRFVQASEDERDAAHHRAVTPRPRHLPRHRHVARRADDRLRLRRLPLRPIPRDRRLRGPSIYVELPDGASRRWSTRRPTCARRRSRSACRASTRSSSRTATPITSWASTRCGASTRMQGAAIPCYADAATAAEIAAHVRRTSSSRARRKGGGIPQLDLFTIAGPFCLGRTLDRARAAPARPPADSRLPHRAVRVPDRLQPRFPTRRGRCSDGRATCSSLDALRERPHPTHFRVSEALDGRRPRWRPQRTYFTHICHDLPHAADLRAPASPACELAYDGLTLEFAL